MHLGWFNLSEPFRQTPIPSSFHSRKFHDWSITLGGVLVRFSSKLASFCWLQSNPAPSQGRKMGDKLPNSKELCDWAVNCIKMLHMSLGYPFAVWWPCLVKILNFCKVSPNERSIKCAWYNINWLQNTSFITLRKLRECFSQMSSLHIVLCHRGTACNPFLPTGRSCCGHRTHLSSGKSSSREYSAWTVLLHQENQNLESSPTKVPTVFQVWC